MIREPFSIGRQHRMPLLPVRRSLTTGYVGRMSNWSGTPRCLTELRNDRDVESRWWWSHAYAALLGATLVLVAVFL